MNDPLDRGDRSGRPDLPTGGQIQARQRARARVMALLLGAFVILMFAISIAKIRSGH